MRSAILLALLVLPAAAQPTILNTKLRNKVTMSSPSWCAGNWGYENASGRFVIQTKGSGGLEVVDVTDPANPVVASVIPGTATGGISVKEVKVWNTYAYATTDNGPTRIINLTNPYAATVVASLTTGAHTLQIQGDRLYLNRASQGYVEFRNLAANPLNPPVIGRFPVSGTTGVHDCAPEGNIMYLFGGNSGTKIVDVTNPAAPVQLGTLPTFGYNHSGDLYVTPSGQKILLSLDEGTGGPCRVWNVTNPAAPVLLHTYQTNPTLSIHNCYIRGAYAFIAYYNDGLRVLDLTNPASPVEIGIFDPNPTNAGASLYSGTWDIYPYHDAIYVGEMYNNASVGTTAGTWVVDFFPGFGTGSPGTGGLVPEPWWSFGPPSPGNARFALRLANARPNAAAFLVIGLSNTTFNGSPLPMSLASAGAPGSTLYVSLDGLIPVTTDASGNASVALPIPPSLTGTFWCQWGVVDPAGGGGLAVTKGGKLVVE